MKARSTTRTFATFATPWPRHWTWSMCLSRLQRWRSAQRFSWSPGWRSLASALSYLHALTPTPVMHRNLKSSNCMLSHGGAKLRLTDFTTACLAFPAADLTPRMGSVRWMAPEVLTDRPYGPPADMYGFGMVCYEMVSYQVPFADCTIAQACVKASAGERPHPKGVP